MNSHAIHLTQTPGRCRWCRCTEFTPCANGCSWGNAAMTVCSECVPLDRAMKNVPGRRELAEFLQEHDFLRLAPKAKRKRAPIGGMHA